MNAPFPFDDQDADAAIRALDDAWEGPLEQTEDPGPTLDEIIDRATQRPGETFEQWWVRQQQDDR